jgi:hypothetical protein
MQYRYHSLQTPNSFTNFHRSWRADLHWTLELWTTFLSDQRLKCRPYLKMICVRKAIVILGLRIIRCDWRGFGSEMSQFFRQGILDPRAIYYHLFYFLRFKRERLGRLLP